MNEVKNQKQYKLYLQKKLNSMVVGATVIKVCGVGELVLINIPAKKFVVLLNSFKSHVEKKLKAICNIVLGMHAPTKCKM
jgi:hypothetical protein